MQQKNESNLQVDLIGSFKRFYEQFDQHSFDLLGDIYAENIGFTDPVHSIRGLGDLKSYFKCMCSNLSYCRFHFVSEVVGESSAFFKWEMNYKHPSLKSNAALQLTGATLIEFTDKVDVHEDFYDMGAMLYEHLPVMGSAVRLIKTRMAKIE